MHRILAKPTVGAPMAELLQLIATGPRGGTRAVLYLSAADALRLADELEAAAHELLGETNGTDAR